MSGYSVMGPSHVNSQSKYNLGLSNGSRPGTGTLQVTGLTLGGSASQELAKFMAEQPHPSSEFAMVDMDDLPTTLLGTIVRQLRDLTKNMEPSSQPGLGAAGSQIQSVIGFDPIIPDHLTLHINSAGGGVGVRFSTERLKVEFGVHIVGEGGM